MSHRAFLVCLMSSTGYNESFAFDLTALCFSAGCAGGGILTPRKPPVQPRMGLWGGIPPMSPCGDPHALLQDPLLSLSNNPQWENLQGMLGRPPPHLPIPAFPKGQGWPRWSPFALGAARHHPTQPQDVPAMLPGSGWKKMATHL